MIQDMRQGIGHDDTLCGPGNVKIIRGNHGRGETYYTWSARTDRTVAGIPTVVMQRNGNGIPFQEAPDYVLADILRAIAISG